MPRTTGPTPVRVDLDLDQLRASSADGHAGVRRKSFRLDGHVYDVPAKLPVFVLVLLDDGDVSKGFRLLLGDEQFNRIAQTDLTSDELETLLETLYGADLGESEPSGE